MNAKKLAELLQKYEDGQCNEEERLMIEKLYQDFDADMDTLPDSRIMQPAYERLYENIENKIKVDDRKGLIDIRFWRYAAAAAIILSLGLGSWYFMQKPVEKQLASLTFPKSEKVKKHFIRLPDGSTVLLNERSKLEYPAKFDGPLREVSLTGEGYFDIVANSKQPFIVHTGKVVTTVLGTVFNIKSDADAKEVTVTVEKGKVKVASEGKELGVLESNQQIQVNKSVTFTKTDTVNVEPVTDWIKEDLVFNNMTYTDAAKVLNAQYGINIVFQGGTPDVCRFTTSFKNQSSLEEILTVLCAFNQSTYSIQDSTVFIQGGTCQ